MHELDQIEDVALAREVRRMTGLACARPQDRIAVVGPRSLDYVLALFRSGFEHALCISAQTPRACGEAIDHLFVSGPLEDDRLQAVVADVGGHLGETGCIVARVRDVEQDRIICEALSTAGVVQPAPVFDSSRDMLVRHRCYARVDADYAAAA